MEPSIKNVTKFIDNSEFIEESMNLKFLFANGTLNINGKVISKYDVVLDKVSNKIQIRNKDYTLVYGVISLYKESFTIRNGKTIMTLFKV
jgi:hypothetical protein